MYLEQYEGKEIYNCQFIGTRLNYNTNTFSLCHEAQVGDRILGKLEDVSPESYYQALSELIVANEKEDAPCRHCTKCKKEVFYQRKLDYIILATSNRCNSSCIYCMSHFGDNTGEFNPIPSLEEFYKQGLLAENCFFDWGGGEPTIGNYFEECVDWISRYGYWQQINTNAILYSENTARMLSEKAGNVRISVDSGSFDGFYRIKGHKGYDAVWENIGKYCALSNEVYIKYNVCNYNSDKEEMDAFLIQCKKHGVKHILVDGEISSYQPMRNAGRFYFREKEHDAARYLYEEAKKNGFLTEVSPYAFSVREEYDKDGSLMIPTKYFDNIDKDILCNDIQVKTFASVDQMIEQIFEQNEKQVIIWGAGKYGGKIKDILQKNGLHVDYFVDSDKDKQKDNFLGISVISPEELFQLWMGSVVILAGIYWREMLKKINRANYYQGEIYYLPERYYDEWTE